MYAADKSGARDGTMGRLRAILGRERGLSEGERARLAGRAVQLHREMAPAEHVIDALVAEGATAEEARAISREAERRVDRDVAASVRLPESALMDVNYYFLLGLTPGAGPDDVHAAFRRKAREVHPDLHARDFTSNQWQELMTVVADADQVLTDPLKRRAYDVFWRRRSNSVAMRFRRPGEKRGDLETRFRWEVAAMAEMEHRLAGLLEQLQNDLSGKSDIRPSIWSLERLFEQYEGALIELRIQTRALPSALDDFSARVRAEMQRKESVVRALRLLLPGNSREITASDEYSISAGLGDVMRTLDDTRQAQHVFDLGALRPFI